MLGEGLRTVAALQHEGAARRNLGKAFLERAGLPCKNQRREACQLLLDGAQSRCIGIGRYLLGGCLPPAIRRPMR